MNMPLIGSVFGVLLIALGIVGFIGGDMEHKTALIPSFVGLLILIASLIGFKESCLKHAMHAAAVFGVLGMLASLARIIQQLTRGEFEFDLKGICLVGMVVISGTFIALCVKSFKDARKAREA